jgi:hypothetical protein
MDKYIWLASVVLGLIAICWFLLKWMPGQSIKEKTWPRLFAWVPLSIFLMTGLYVVSPQQAEVVYYKFSLVILGAFLGYLIDKVLFPYARPDGYLHDFWQHGAKEIKGEVDHAIVDGYKHVFGFVMIRRAIIVTAVILSVALGM